MERKTKFKSRYSYFAITKNRPELIEEYSQIIIDEVHHIPAVSFEIPLKNLKVNLF